MGTTESRNSDRRILMLSKYFSYGHGGTPEAVLLLARSFKKIGVSVDVRAHDRFIIDAGMLNDLPPPHIELNEKISIQISDYCGLVIAGAWIFEALKFAVLARKAGVPVIYQTKGQLCKIEFTRLRDLRRLLYLIMIEIWVAILSTQILFTSQLERDNSLLPGFLKKTKGNIFPEPLDSARLGFIKRPAREADHTLRIGFIAQISPRKGLREFVEGYLSWTLANPDYAIELTIAGTAVGASENYLTDIQSLIISHPGNASVSFIGQISGEDRSNFYRDADVVAVPSHFESFCLAVPEALWFGCAVLAAPRLGVLEFLRHHPAIITISDISPAGVSKAMDKLTQAWPNLHRNTGTHNNILALDPIAIADSTWALIKNASH